MRHLAGGMYTRIGAARAYKLDGLVGDQAKRLFQALLHAQSGFLTLPAVIPGAVVFDAERDANVCAR
jgi:hypothetical protein